MAQSDSAKTHQSGIDDQAGQEIDLGTTDTTLEVVNPTPGSTVPAMDNGIVLKLSDEKISFLLTSDISADAEHDLITQRADVNCTVLKVAHHGSNDSKYRPLFLAVADPKLAVIFSGGGQYLRAPGRGYATAAGGCRGGE